MKRVLSLGIVMIAVMFGNIALAAQESPQVSVGMSMWPNSWEITSGGVSIESANAAMMIGPNLKIRSGQVFAGLSYLGAISDYEFRDGAATLKFSRKDLDLIAGYMFTPRVGGFFGYKSISSDISGHEYGLTINAGTLKITGPGLGITGNTPLNDKAVLYGSLGLMSLESKFEGYKGEDMSGATIEIGASFSLNDQLSGNVSIKSQGFSNDNDTVEHSFSGLVLGGSYRF